MDVIYRLAFIWYGFVIIFEVFKLHAEAKLSPEDYRYIQNWWTLVAFNLQLNQGSCQRLVLWTSF